RAGDTAAESAAVAQRRVCGRGDGPDSAVSKVISSFCKSDFHRGPDGADRSRNGYNAMRITSSQSYQAFLQGLQSIQQRLQQDQTEITSGNRINQPSDDP